MSQFATQRLLPTQPYSSYQIGMVYRNWCDNEWSKNWLKINKFGLENWWWRSIHQICWDVDQISQWTKWKVIRICLEAIRKWENVKNSRSNSLSWRQIRLRSPKEVQEITRRFNLDWSSKDWRTELCQGIKQGIRQRNTLLKRRDEDSEDIKFKR